MLTKQIHCNDCNQLTKHCVRKSYSQEGEEPFGSGDPSLTYSWKTTWRILECCGCGNVTVEQEKYLSEWEETEVIFFPSPTVRKVPKWLNDLPIGVAEVLEEVYTAINSDNRRLATMGARCLIDLVVIDTVGDVGNFEQKLTALEGEGLIGSKNRTHLDAALNVGNAASHRGHTPTTEALNTLMDIIENFLQATYILDSVAEELNRATPARIPAKKDEANK